MPRPLPRTAAVLLALALTSTAAAPAVVKVRRGDTLWELARRYGTTVEAIQELNGLKGSLIYEGQTLRLTKTPPKAAAARPAAQVYETAYVVRSGDSLYGIAGRFGVDWRVIARRNKLPRSRVVRLGQRLVITRTRVVPARSDKAYVRSLIVREARTARLDPNLALAVAWQESGFQQDVVSSAGAVGVMQVMPGTGRWISRYLVRRPLDLTVVEHNVRAGVQYLAMLVRGARNVEEALAGYYQGLASVRRRGMYDDTKRYVANILALRRRLAGRGAGRS